MQRIDAFVSHLEAIARREDRAALARLRRGLGRRPAEAIEALPLVVPFVPEDAWQQEAFFAVATLFATHPAPGGRGNFGAAFRKMGDTESLKKRFVALLDSHEDELPGRLRQAITLARSRDVPVDYRRLLEDLIHWTHPERYVQLQWARAYWADQGSGSNSDSDSDSTPKDA